jgi:hypothetical protein
MGTIEKYYKVLGIHSGATLDDIKKAFLAMEQRLQQDFESGEPEKRALSREKLREIFEAHEKVVKYFMEHGPPKFQDYVQESEPGHELPVSASAPEPGSEPTADAPGREEQAAEEISPAISSSVENFLTNKTVTLTVIIAFTILVAVSVGALVGLVAFRKSAHKGAPTQPVQQAAVTTATAYTSLSSVEKKVTPQSLEQRADEKRAPAERKHVKTVKKIRKRAVPHQVTRKSRESLEDTITAAKQGDAEAQYRLGVVYDKGLGVKKDKREAVRWYRKAASQGHTKAQDSLEFFYE